MIICFIGHLVLVLWLSMHKVARGRTSFGRFWSLLAQGLHLAVRIFLTRGIALCFFGNYLLGLKTQATMLHLKRNLTYANASVTTKRRKKINKRTFTKIERKEGYNRPAKTTQTSHASFTTSLLSCNATLASSKSSAS